MEFNPVTSTVDNEGATIKYWYQGVGPLLVMLHGNGSGEQYNNIMPLLSKYYKVVAYDRRGYSGSAVDQGQMCNPVQQARDAIAIMKKLNYEKMSIFANSGSGVIAFQLGVSYPQYIEHMVVHEASTISLLPDATNYVDFAFNNLLLVQEEGLEAARNSILSVIKGLDEVPLPAHMLIPRPLDEDFFWKYDYIVFTLYCPDLRRIAQNNVSIAVAAGARSGDASYARTSIEQAAIIGCPRVIVPGHHLGFDAEPEEFAPALLKIFEMLEKARKIE